MARPPDHLPFTPRGLSRPQAAAYVGVGPSLFDRLVAEGTMPQPFHLRGRRVWDRLRLDRAIEALQPETADDPFADVA